jgi:hypothetical protein
MKNVLRLVCIVTFLFSCKKSATPDDTTTNQPTVQSKLKKIVSVDTVVLLCNFCAPIITERAETFVFDNLDRLVKRTKTNTTLSNTPQTVDTLTIYTYVYFGTNTKVESYSEQSFSGSGAISINHALDYDSQNRLLRDSVINPVVSNNKVTRFTYLPNTIVEYERQTFPVGTQQKIDSFFLNGNEIVRHRFGTGNNIFTLTTYQNPLSDLSNFSLRASDYKNGSASTLFTIYTPYYVTTSQASQVAVNANSGTSYVAVLNYSLDSIGRIKFFTNSANGYKRTTFEYY